MSYQPFPNDPGNPQQGFAQPVVQQPGQPFGAAAQPGKRRTGLIIVGVIVLVGGIGGGLALAGASGTSYQEGVENLARAPIGCVTSLDFESTGTFTIYIETEGEIGEVRGDCDNVDDSYEWDDDDLPDVDLVLLDPDDDELDLDDDDSKSYDVGGFTGQSIYSVEIEDTGRHSLTVESDDEDFAIAVGKDPKSSSGMGQLLGYALIGVGLVLGVILILLGMRRKPASGSGSSAPPFGGEQAFSQAPVGAVGGQGFPPTQQYPGQQYPPQAAPPTVGGFGQPQWPSPPNS